MNCSTLRDIEKLFKKVIREEKFHIMITNENGKDLVTNAFSQGISTKDVLRNITKKS